MIFRCFVFLFSSLNFLLSLDPFSLQPWREAKLPLSASLPPRPRCTPAKEKKKGEQAMAGRRSGALLLLLLLFACSSAALEYDVDIAIYGATSCGVR